jgi:DNA-nicking Smr family endonuclease/mRNA-degrading endonuclease HigB of HigAB toxin-antitoxin module
METENVAPPTEEEPVDYAQQVRGLDTYLEQLKEKAKTTKDLDEKIALGEKYNEVQKARAEAEAKAKEANKPIQQLSLLKRKMEIAEEEGDIPAQVELAKKIKALGFTTENLTQAEIPLVPFKAKSESTPDFVERILAPKRPLANAAAQQRLGTIESEEQDYLEQQRLAQEKADKETERERKLAPEQSALQRIASRRAGSSDLSQMYRGRLPQDVTEQLDMFGMPLSGGVVTGEKAAAPKSRAELVAEVQIGRITGNRQAVAETAEKIRDMDATGKGRVENLTYEDWAALIGPVEGPAQPNAKHTEISADDATLLRKMVIKTVKDFTYNIFYPNFRSNILSSVKDIFYSSTNKFNLKPNTVVINIGCNTYKLVSLTDVTFQNLICDMIILKKEISFCLIGQSHQICSERLLNLNYDNVLNLIDRDEGLFDLMNIFYNAKLLLSRDTGAIHLAGLSNCNVICLKPQFSVFKPKSKVIYKLKTILHKNPITQNSGHFIEPDHLFYIRRYMPLSDNICEISEYIRYDDNYNNNLMILIIKNILLFLNENKF